MDSPIKLKEFVQASLKEMTVAQIQGLSGIERLTAQKMKSGHSTSIQSNDFILLIEKLLAEHQMVIAEIESSSNE